MTDRVTFEHPMNERFRLLLRLEHLFSLISSSRDCGNECADRTVLGAMSDILQVTTRNNVKQDLLRCIERQHERFSMLRNSEKVDRAELGRVIKSLDSLSHRLRADSSAIGHELQAHPLLEGVRRRALQPGGTSPVDMPDLHRWLSQPDPDKQIEVRSWQNHLSLCEEGVTKVLELSRLSCEMQDEEAEHGFFHISVSDRPSIQLVHVSTLISQSGYPEISGNSHRVTIRWVTQGARGERPKQIARNVDFRLGFCFL